MEAVVLHIMMILLIGLNILIPSERRKGYGTKQLKLILNFAKQSGLQEVIVACDKDNIASAKTAMSCGGILVKEFTEDGMVKQHYHFELNCL